MLVIILQALEFLKLGLEKSLGRLNLGLLGVATVIGCVGEVLLKTLDAILDPGVLDLRLRNVRLQLVLGLAVGAAESTLVQLANVVNVVC